MITANGIRVAMLAAGTLLGGLVFDHPLAQFCVTDSRVLYLLAQYKTAIGDTASGVELLRRAASSEQKKNNSVAPSPSGAARNRAATVCSSQTVKG